MDKLLEVHRDVLIENSPEFLRKPCDIWHYHVDPYFGAFHCVSSELSRIFDRVAAGFEGCLDVLLTWSYNQYRNIISIGRQSNLLLCILAKGETSDIPSQMSEKWLKCKSIQHAG